MTEDLLIPHDALILVADGGKALILTNAGTPTAPRLEVVKTLTAPANPPDRDQGSDRPGRVFKGVRRAATQETDRHALAERRFAEEAAAAFDTAAAGDGALLIVAPAPTLATLRATLSDAIRARVIAEIPKDLVNHPAAEIRKVLTGA